VFAAVLETADNQPVNAQFAGVKHRHPVKVYIPGRIIPEASM
jgi:hypothetical protein